jgi:surface protein
MAQARESSAYTAHLQRAAVHARRGDTRKAAAHVRRALEYAGRSQRSSAQAFGVQGDEEPTRTSLLSKLDTLPFQLKWKVLTQGGCDAAIMATRGASLETRQGLYDTQMTKEIDPASLFVPAQCRLASGLDERHPNFTYRCSRFFQNCAERDGRFDARVMNLTDETIREVLAQHKGAITNGTFYPPIAEWDVSRITNMRNLFSDWTEFNSPLERWDTSNVLNMAGMFSGCRAFNQPIGRWNTSRVTKMSRMFRNAVAFNQPIGAWRTESVEIMSAMFEGAAAFQHDISGWDVSAVRHAWGMFERATLPAHMRPRLTPDQLDD